MTRPKVWNNETFEMVESARDYDVIEVHATGEDYDYRRVLREQRLYIDTENGITVADVGIYESWLREKGLA